MEQTDGEGRKQPSIDAMPQEVAIVAADGTIMTVNDSWRAFADKNSGRHPTYWVGENYFTVCEQAETNLTDEGIAANLRAVVAGDTDHYRHEYPGHSPVEQQWFRLDATRFHHDGDPHLLVAHTDITRQKLAELQATARTEQLETVLDVLQHDLRNPLNIIHGYVEQLATDVDDDDTIDAIQEAVTRVTEITDATLSFTESGALSETEPLSVGELARTAWLSVQTADATLVVEESHQIIGDRRLLLQLFENLFRNAVEHAGADCTIRLGTLETGFSLEDDGPGIPEAIREKAVQADYSTQGTGGLGLALVQAVVKAHGGEVTITEAENSGARFEFTGFDIPPNPIET